MTTFIDGPAKGQTLMLKSASVFLRAVIDPAGKWDALDRFSDAPLPKEKCYVYRLQESKGSVHLNAGKSRGTYPIVTYFYWPTQPSEEIMRSTPKWRQWCGDNVNADPANSAGDLFALVPEISASSGGELSEAAVSHAYTLAVRCLGGEALNNWTCFKRHLMTLTLYVRRWKTGDLKGKIPSSLALAWEVTHNQAIGADLYSHDKHGRAILKDGLYELMRILAKEPMNDVEQ